MLNGEKVKQTQQIKGEKTEGKQKAKAQHFSLFFSCEVNSSLNIICFLPN